MQIRRNMVLLSKRGATSRAYEYLVYDWVNNKSTILKWVKHFDDQFDICRAFLHPDCWINRTIKPLFQPLLQLLPPVTSLPHLRLIARPLQVVRLRLRPLGVILRTILSHTSLLILPIRTIPPCHLPHHLYLRVQLVSNACSRF